MATRNRAHATVPITISTTSHLSASIALSDIKDGIIDLKFMKSGKIYASLGGPLGQQAPPDPRNPSDPAYYLAWQTIAEITYTGTSSDSGDMESINLFGVPASVAVSIDQNREIVQQAGFTISETALINQLLKLSTTPNEITIKNSADEVVHLLSPVSFGPTTDQQGTLYCSIGFERFSGQGFMISRLLRRPGVWPRPCAKVKSSRFCPRFH